MARPRKENPLVVLSMRVEPGTADRIAELALETSRPQSDLLRLVVEAGLDAMDEERARPRRARERQVIEAVRELSGRAGLVELPQLRTRLRIEHDVLDELLLGLERAGELDLKVANDQHGLDARQGILRGGRLLWFVAPR